jgi:hypothetical protein
MFIPVFIMTASAKDDDKPFKMSFIWRIILPVLVGFVLLNL